MDNKQVQELLYQAMETEIGGAEVYRTAVRCAQQDELREEWQKYLEETENHQRILMRVFEAFGLDPEAESPGRKVVRFKGENLVKAMEQAMEAGDGKLAQLVAAECIVEAETKDHQNWELIGRIAEDMGSGEKATALKEAYGEVEEQEDEHLYHTMGWARELWIESLGMPAVLPPPEERKDVRTAIGAARAEQAREEQL